jgi:hypothetical protein
LYPISKVYSVGCPGDRSSKAVAALRIPHRASARGRIDAGARRTSFSSDTPRKRGLLRFRRRFGTASPWPDRPLCLRRWRIWAPERYRRYPRRVLSRLASPAPVPIGSSYLQFVGASKQVSRCLARPRITRPARPVPANVSLLVRSLHLRPNPQALHPLREGGARWKRLAKRPIRTMLTQERRRCRL